MRIIKATKLYGRFIMIYLKNMMEYRFYFFMEMFNQGFAVGIGYLSIWVILNRFHSINGWSYYEVIFLYSLNYLSYGISSLFFWGPMQGLGGMVREGTFDSILTRPMNPLFHLVSRQFLYLCFGYLSLAVIIIIICFKNLGIEWTVIKAMWFFAVMVGAVLIQASLMIVAGTTSFWLIRTTSVVDTMIYGLRRFLNYPISIYSKWVQAVLTFVVPYAFVNFYPAQHFLNKTDGLFHPVFAYGTPVVGLVLSILAYKFWCFGIKHYQSTGS